eukprot:gene38915-52559_t
MASSSARRPSPSAAAPTVERNTSSVAIATLKPSPSSPSRASRKKTSRWSNSPATAPCGRASSTMMPTPASPPPSPRGIIWPPMPHNDEAGWERVRKVGAFFTKLVATCGAGITLEKSIELGTYPYPIFVTYASQTPDTIHTVVKAMIDNYDAYKDGAPGAAGLAAKRQTMKWVVPFHPGAVKAMKEAGNWSDADQAHNDGLIKRQDVLKTAWVAFNKAAPSDDKEFAAAWTAARAAALKTANMPDAGARPYCGFSDVECFTSPGSPGSAASSGARPPARCGWI